LVSGGSIASFYDSSAVEQGRIQASTSALFLSTVTTNPININVNSTTVGTFNAYGLGLGTAVPSSGIGLSFPATQSASTDANTLDDYEEGTWTPSLGGTATYTSRTGSYTKIGRFVYVTVAMAINVIGTGSTFRISGLPFNAGVATGAAGSVSYAAALSQNVVSFTVGVNAGDIDVYTMLAANTASSNNSIFGNTTTIQLSATYYV
jgi:peptidoglycan hydrolase-like protein with peptidoglycan-binding domain